MPIVVNQADQADYARFPAEIERDWLGRWCHLSDADIGRSRRRAGDVTRLGFAVQLAQWELARRSDRRGKSRSPGP